MAVVSLKGVHWWEENPCFRKVEETEQKRANDFLEIVALELLSTVSFQMLPWLHVWVCRKVLAQTAYAGSADCI